MESCYILLNTIDSVRDFVNKVSMVDFDVDLVSGRYVVDAKSILGIFSLDLSKPIRAELHGGNVDAFKAAVAEYMVEK